MEVPRDLRNSYKVSKLQTQCAFQVQPPGCTMLASSLSTCHMGMDRVPLQDHGSPKPTLAFQSRDAEASNCLWQGVREDSFQSRRGLGTAISPRGHKDGSKGKACSMAGLLAPGPKLDLRQVPLLNGDLVSQNGCAPPGPVPQGLVHSHSHWSLPGKKERIITGFSSHRDVIPRGHLLTVGNLHPRVLDSQN